MGDKIRAFVYRIQSALVGSRVYKDSPRLAEILADPLVNANLLQAWYQSNPNAPEVPGGQPGSKKREQGGWIIWNRGTGKLAVVRVSAGVRECLPTLEESRPGDSVEQVVVA